MGTSCTLRAVYAVSLDGAREEGRRGLAREPEAARDYLTPLEVSRLLKVSTRYLYRLRRDELGPPWLKVAGQVRYDRAGFNAWLDSRRHGPRPPYDSTD